MTEHTHDSTDKDVSEPTIIPSLEEEQEQLSRRAEMADANLQAELDQWRKSPPSSFRGLLESVAGFISGGRSR